MVKLVGTGKAEAPLCLLARDPGLAGSATARLLEEEPETPDEKNLSILTMFLRKPH